MASKSEKESIGSLGTFPKGSKVAIFTHDTPDADAMASAYGLQWILKKKYSVSSDIFYGGEISHPENQAMVNVLSLSLYPSEDYFIDESKYNYVAIVDATDSNVDLKERKPNFIIDHHKTKIKEEEYDFVLNRQVGSCCSLIYDLIESEGLDLTSKDDSDKNISTALLFGLIKDTNNLLSENSVELDFHVYRQLSAIADTARIKEIQNYPLPDYFFQMSAKAIQEDSYIESNGTFASFIGYLAPAKRDVLPHLADMFIRKDGISTTIVAAIVGDNIEASIRSQSVSIDVNSFSQKVFGKEFAGGKRGAGGAKIPLGFFTLGSESDTTKEKMIDLVKSLLLDRIQKEISSDS